MSYSKILEQEIHRIYDEKGRLDPQDIVDESRDKSAPLHDRFTWDDTVAANEHRLHQARGLIVQVRFEVPDEPDIPAYVNVRSGGESYYEKVEVAVKDRDVWQSVMNETYSKLAGFEKRLDALLYMETDASRIKATKRVLRHLNKAADAAGEARA